jgi:sigma54-dependent transcription regulator
VNDVTPSLDEARIAALATRLSLTPRELLALAGRVAAQPDAPLDATRLDAEIARLHAAPRETADAAALALLGYGGFAVDDIDRALALVWTHANAAGT